MLDFTNVPPSALLLNRSKIPLRSFEADIVLGVLGKNCRGLGICKIAPLYSLPKNCRVTQATIDKILRKLIRLRFDPASVCKVQLQRQFSKGCFRLEEDFVLPDFLIRKLQLEKRLIRRGKYKLVKHGKYYYVYFFLFTR